MTVRIDVEQLTIALGDHASEWVLDRETGQVLMAEWLRDPSLLEDMDLGIDPDEDDGDALLEGDRFVDIDPVPSHEGFRWMERFAEAVEDGAVRARLLDALNRPKPFRRFRDALPGELRDGWHRYEEEQLAESARAWLRSVEIEAELVNPHRLRQT